MSKLCGLFPSRLRARAPFWFLVGSAIAFAAGLTQGVALAEPEVAASAPYASMVAVLDRWIAVQVKTRDVPGLSIALVDDQRVVWAKGFGLADPERSIPASAETVYRAGSVSKLFTDIALMQLVEQGLVELDAPVKRYLPDFEPRNPFATAITVRHLMSHTSGLVREPPVGHYFDPSSPPLPEVVKSLNQTTLVHEPGTIVKYSNAGVTVVGAIIEKVRGESFPNAVSRSLLLPLGMSHSSFDPGQAAPALMAKGAMWTPDGRVVATPVFALGTGPAGNLVSTVTDLGKFISFLFAEGRAAGVAGAVVKPETLHSMIETRPTAAGKTSTFGLGFAVSSIDGQIRIGHNGAIYGFATELEALPNHKLGVVVMASLDCANGLTQYIAENALRGMIAAKGSHAFAFPELSRRVPLERARKLRGHYENGASSLDIDEQSGKLWLTAFRGYSALELRQLGDRLVIDDVVVKGPELVVKGDELTLVGDTFTRKKTQRPADLKPEWRGLIGEYGWDHDVLYILERDGKLSALIEWFFEYPLVQESPDHFRFPAEGLYASEPVVFSRDQAGRSTRANVAGMRFERRHLDGEGDATFRVKPVRPVSDVRAEFASARPPVENGHFVKPDLVEVAKRDPSIRLDIRYATDNNFLGVPLYTTARAFLQRPAAQAVARVHQALGREGYQLLIHDAYRPWSVTKLFWEAVPASGKGFVADPTKGSKHNRGAAVDLTLFSTIDNAPTRMVGGYDEFSPRSHPYYPGGTSRERWQRNLLRYEMEREGFTVNRVEWWHFDYQGWEHFPILNLDFDRAGAGGNSDPPTATRAGPTPGTN
jgi:CubicO group peptidase (beta-lactamase class C family)/D-alanyl-D-alanine dipeptidase